MPVPKTKPCIDCGVLIYKHSTRCNTCAKRFRKDTNNAINTPEYKEHIAAERVNVEYIDDNTVVITAYQGKATIQIKYYKDSLYRLLKRLNMGISAITLDPKVYNSRQNGTITINQDTKFIRKEGEIIE